MRQSGIHAVDSSSSPIRGADEEETKVGIMDRARQSCQEGRQPRSTLLDPIPKLNSREISERIKRYPMKKNEMIEYLLRIHKVDKTLDP